MFDTHCHLSDPKFNNDRNEVIERAREKGIENILIVCSQTNEIESFCSMLAEYDFIYGALGVHPHNAKHFERDWPHLEKIIKNEKIVALGEIGLDYHYDHSPREIQREVFRKQLRLAKEHDLPLIIHSREAMDECLSILKEEDMKQGVMHCFSGNIQEARECLEMGLYISIAGVVTFPKATGLKDIARKIPMDRLLLETDAPYLAPQSVRGKRNEPSYISHTYEAVASLRAISTKDLSRTTKENAMRLFKK
ncbi:MAG: TatD family hydrolase [bacterium]